ncbi:hypothetical protein BDFB_003032 [Asbolus verrucosus]|uniref:Uncharacterized protein n=1 Tax=Asbolus verrucosus TaxID=1661398 RepID=A0A482VU84_ASBVE|nr:hypothetical protein BDFB_003032 [Asbolus verrucosus]
MNGLKFTWVNLRIGISVMIRPPKHIILKNNQTPIEDVIIVDNRLYIIEYELDRPKGHGMIYDLIATLP